MNTIVCPECLGSKGSYGLGCGPGISSLTYVVACSLCGGSGTVPNTVADNYETWKSVGQFMRDWRQTKDRSLREEASIRNMSVVLLSNMERGYVEPIPSKEMRECDSANPVPNP